MKNIIGCLHILDSYCRLHRLEETGRGRGEESLDIAATPDVDPEDFHLFVLVATSCTSRTSYV